MKTTSTTKAVSIPPRLVAAKLNGRKGGLKRAATTTSEQRSEWASKAGTSTLSRYGSAYFRHIRAMRKTWPKKNRRRSKCDMK
jgi:hypothetical protein